MERQIGDLLACIRSAATSDRVKSFARAAAHIVGFSHFSYVQDISLACCNGTAVTLSNLPASWHRQYASARHIHVDPAVKHCWHRQEPMAWHEDQFSRARALWSDLAAEGLRAGCAQGISAPFGIGSRGMLNLARDSPAVCTNELRDITPFLAELARAVHETMLRLTDTHLTDREREVLRWTAAGKTSAEIAQILLVSENTIKFHIRNVTSKLGVTNKTAAAVKAALSGLLNQGVHCSKE